MINKLLKIAKITYNGDNVELNGNGALQSKTVAPSESAVNVTPDDGYYGLSDVSVSAIPSNYIGTTIPRKNDDDISVSGSTVTVPAGYYESECNKTVESAESGGAYNIDVTTDENGYQELAISDAGEGTTLVSFSSSDGLQPYYSDDDGDYYKISDQFIESENLIGATLTISENGDESSIVINGGLIYSVGEGVYVVAGYLLFNNNENYMGFVPKGVSALVEKSYPIDSVMISNSVIKSNPVSKITYNDVNLDVYGEIVDAGVPYVIANYGASAVDSPPNTIRIMPVVENESGRIVGGTVYGETYEYSTEDLTYGTKYIYENGTYNIMNYASVQVEVSESAPSMGTAGTPVAVKGSVSNNSVTITPTVTNTEGYIYSDVKNGTPVTVTAAELVSGSLSVTENGSYDVTNLSTVVVNIESTTASDAECYDLDSQINSDGSQTLMINDHVRTDDVSVWEKYDVDFLITNFESGVPSVNKIGYDGEFVFISSRHGGSLNPYSNGSYVNIYDYIKYEPNGTIMFDFDVYGSTTGYQRILSLAWSKDGSMKQRINIYSAPNSSEFKVENASTEYSDIASSGTFVVQYTNTGVSVYYPCSDGTTTKRVFIIEDGATAVMSTACIGSQKNSYPFNGFLYNIAYFSRNFTDEEIEELMSR